MNYAKKLNVKEQNWNNYEFPLPDHNIVRILTSFMVGQERILNYGLIVSTGMHRRTTETMTISNWSCLHYSMKQQRQFIVPFLWHGNKHSHFKG
uniref:Uncharacterized protein n=1 Tax=Romanomermis culicivorax TaxID=13658 RepID=A0A915I6F7_ROMCU